MAKVSHNRAVERAARAHTNLSTFAVIVSILEGGHLYGGSPRSNGVARKIIVACQREQAALLREYDEAVAEAGKVSP